MDGTVKLVFTFIGYGVLIWSVISDSIARAIIGIGLLFVIGLDNERWIKPSQLTGSEEKGK